MKILVTGGEGFIGSHVIPKLAGHEVVSVDCFEEQVHGADGRKNCKFDTRALCVSEMPFRSFDVVIHLAALVGVGQSMAQPHRYVRMNTDSTAKMLERIETKRLIVASSMSIYGEGAYDKDGNPMPTPETKTPELRSIYALTKYDQEQLCLIWGSAFNVPTVALRFFNVYGPGQALTNPYTGALAIFATRILNGKAPVVYEDGQQTRDFINVEDIADAVVHAATTDIPSGVYNVGTGAPNTIERVARLLSENLGADLPPLITGQKRAGDIRHCYADASKLKATGWTPRVSFENGIKAYCDWLRTQPVPEDRFDKAAHELLKAGLVK